MKLGLAEQHPPYPPTILVLGEGAVALQIKQDLESLGLMALLVSDLRLAPEFVQLPRPSDVDAQSRLTYLFEEFQKRGPEHSWVHPGVTVWSERYEFEGWARRAGLNAITSPAKVLSLFWNHLNLIRVAQRIGVPTLMLSDDPLTSVREIEDRLKQLIKNGQASLPVVLKSGYRINSGFGMRVLHAMEELQEWAPIWMNQIQEQSGEAILFVERYLESARSYMQPFVRFKTGEIEFFPLIDASLIADGRNWIEVCPAQNVDDTMVEKIESYSAQIAAETEFVGLGLLIYLSNGVEAYLVEGIARLNFGYNLWEKVARTQAVAWQLAALAPSLMPVRPQVRTRVGSANPICGMNLKLYAEDSILKIPQPGEVFEVSEKTEWSDIEKDGFLIWDILPGRQLTWENTSSLGQLTVFSTSWKSALRSAREILEEIWISGSIQTNERYLAELLAHPWVEESIFYTGFVDEEFIPKQGVDPKWLDWISRAIAEVSPPIGENESWIWMNQKLPPLPKVAPIHWVQRMEFISAQGFRGVRGYIQDVGRSERISVCPLSHTRIVIRIRNWFFSIRRSTKGRPLQLMALTSGRVHSIFFKEGATVAAKQCVLIIESLQNLVSHKLPVSVKLKALKVKAEDVVIVGQELAELERTEDS